MKTEFGVLVAQGFSTARDGGRLLFQEIILDSEKMLKLTDPDEMIDGVSVNNRVMIIEEGGARIFLILHSDLDRIAAEDYFFGHRSDPMLRLVC